MSTISESTIDQDIRTNYPKSSSVRRIAPRNLRSDYRGYLFVKSQIQDANLDKDSPKSILNHSLIITDQSKRGTDKRIGCLSIN